MHSKQELIERARSVLSGQEGLKFAFLYGSVARGRAGPLSDVDVGVFHDPPRRDLRRLHPSLTEALGTDRLDLVQLNGAGPLLRQRVLRDGLPILVDDPAALTRFRYLSQLDYLDTAPLRQLWWSAFRQRWARPA